MLKVLAGELEPEAGDVQINNQSMQSLKIRDLASIRSVMTQGSQIVFEFTVKEVVLFGWLNEQEILWDVFEAVVKSVAIDNLLNQKFNTVWRRAAEGSVCAGCFAVAFIPRRASR